MPPTRAQARADEQAMTAALTKLEGIPLGPVRVLRDGAPVSPLLPSTDAACAWLLRHQAQSFSWALAFEGYSIESAGAEPWAPAERRAHEGAALRVLAGDGSRGHGHQLRFTPAQREEEELTRDNCGPCVLRGWNELPGADPAERRRNPRLRPNYAGWARLYVEARRPVPDRWRDAFTAELNGDNERYVAALSRSLATFGVRFTDDLPEFVRRAQRPA